MPDVPVVTATLVDDDDTRSVTERALARSEPELKPEVLVCLECERRAVLPDQRCVKHSKYKLSIEERRLATKEYLGERLPELSRLLMKGARIEAGLGKTTTARWAMEHLRVVDPIETKAPAAANVGVQIIIPALLPGLKEPTP